MRRPSSLTRLLPLVIATALAAGGCAGLGDSILHPGATKEPPTAAAPLTPTSASQNANVLVSEDAQPQIEALTASIDRLNLTQAQLQVALQDLQVGASRQAEAARLASEDAVSARRGTLVFAVIAAAAVLVALLLAVIVVRQSSQVRRAVRALAEAENQLEQATTAAERLAPGGARGPVRDGAGTATGAGGAVSTTPAPGVAGGSAPGAAPGSQAARLRKRPPVG